MSGLVRRWTPELGWSALLVGVVVSLWAVFAPGVGCRQHALGSWQGRFAVSGTDLLLLRCGSQPWTLDLRLVAGGLGLLVLGTLLVLLARRL
ncbi:hypothetical protein [Haloarchaeobius amylolyticus]|uniref:hypothetical protein n=1 Tax=Haloarchaeobius amylolyticus TaxID=1198296 RepID=UPI00226F26C9|nr:hypothetical protein [Haloarchaeobius amylolyticus]